MDKPKCETCPYWDFVCTGADKLLKLGDTREPPEYATRVKYGHCLLTPTPIEKCGHDFCGQHPDFREWLEERQKEKILTPETRPTILRE